MSHAFELPGGVVFTCTACGDCCRGWDVPLAPGERLRLRDLHWEATVPELQGTEPAVDVLPGQGPVRHRLARKEDGSCAFLGARAQCLIHEHHGADSKPLACRLYPFGFFPLGDRVTVDAAFSCRSVAEGLGEPLEARIPEWTRLLAGGAADRTEHRLQGRQVIAADILWELEHQLVEFMTNRSLNMLERLRCCLLFARLATTGDPGTEAARTLRSAMARGVIALSQRPGDSVLDPTQRAVFYQWLFLALNPSRGGHRPLSGKQRKLETQRRAAAGDRYQDDGNHPFIEDRELPVSFGRIRDVDAAALLADADGQIERFFSAKIIGQRFLQAAGKELSFVDAVPKLALAFPMLAWTAMAHAAERSSPRVEAADIRRAIRLIDRTLGHLATSSMPVAQARACDFVMLETDVVEGAVRELFGGGPA